MDVSVSETINLSDSLLVQRLDTEGTVLGMQEVSSTAPDRAPMRPPAIQWRWYLDELSGIDVVSACEEQLGKLHAIVDECEQRFQT